MTIAEFITKYNTPGTGLFKTGQVRGIGSDDMREFVEDITTLSDIPVNSNPSWRGAHDASSDLYPQVGTGSGIAGAILSGDQWYVSVEGELSAPGSGTITVYPGAILIALINTPDQTATNWKIIQ